MTDYIQRLEDVRANMNELGINGMLVPMADEVQGEFLQPRDERLKWLSGFKGTAGSCLVLADSAALFLDARYYSGAKETMRGQPYDVLPSPKTSWMDWLAEKNLTDIVIGYDPRLHTSDWLARVEKRLAKIGATLKPVRQNPVDMAWTDRPGPVNSRVEVFPDRIAGITSLEKRVTLGQKLTEQDAVAAVITDPAAIAWLLNIRAQDTETVPLAFSRAVLTPEGSVSWYINEDRLSGEVRQHIGPHVVIIPPHRFDRGLEYLSPGNVLLDKATCNLAVENIVKESGLTPVVDECIVAMPKAVKNHVEVSGMAAAHRRDGLALARFMHWLDEEVKANPEAYTEIGLAERLEAERAKANEYRGLSFPTICGTGAHGAIIHYVATPETDAPIENNTLLLIDSGGQYIDGTTDVTRTFAVGTPTPLMRRAYTAVLQGHVDLARLEFQKGITGVGLDAIARAPLWREGMTYGHGTGHGVGQYLNVHEGPQRISQNGGSVPLQAGMVVSNEPGYYRQGAFGIRIENLVAVSDRGPKEDTPFLGLDTLTLAPFERNLIDITMLSPGQRAWIDEYHARVSRTLRPKLEAPVAAWLEQACAPL